MANYFGKSPLKMHCPHCEEYAPHPVVNTDPGWYHWGDTYTAFFQRIAGRDISYRRRTKKCEKCSAQFDTAELSFDFLPALIKECTRLKRESDSNAASANALQNELDRLRSSVTKAVETLTSISPRSDP